MINIDCPVCYDGVPYNIINPCGHSLCEKCSVFEKCPICRGDIISYIPNRILRDIESDVSKHSEKKLDKSELINCNILDIPNEILKSDVSENLEKNLDKSEPINSNISDMSNEHLEKNLDKLKLILSNRILESENSWKNLDKSEMIDMVGLNDVIDYIDQIKKYKGEELYSKIRNIFDLLPKIKSFVDKQINEYLYKLGSNFHQFVYEERDVNLPENICDPNLIADKIQHNCFGIHKHIGEN